MYAALYNAVDKRLHEQTKELLVKGMNLFIIYYDIYTIKPIVLNSGREKNNMLLTITFVHCLLIFFIIGAR